MARRIAANIANLPELVQIGSLIWIKQKPKNPPIYIYIVHLKYFFDLLLVPHHPCEAHMKNAIAPLIAALLLAPVCSVAMADWTFKGWKGHHTKLFDAQNACKNTDSTECEPFLAAAVAVADVFSEIAKPDEKGDLIVSFPNAVQERCSANFRLRMNGPTLLYAALAHPVGSDSVENIYWVSALMRASQQLCHSENPVQTGR